MLFSFCVHDSALFVLCISIIKYCIKHSCHSSASLVPAARWCYFFYRGAVIAAQFIGGHQSLAFLCKSTERLSTALSGSISGQIWDLRHCANCREMSCCGIHLQIQWCSFFFLLLGTWNHLCCIRWQRKKTVISVPSAKREVNLKILSEFKMQDSLFHLGTKWSINCIFYSHFWLVVKNSAGSLLSLPLRKIILIEWCSREMSIFTRYEIKTGLITQAIQHSLQSSRLLPSEVASSLWAGDLMCATQSMWGHFQKSGCGSGIGIYIVFVTNMTPQSTF